MPKDHPPLYRTNRGGFGLFITLIFLGVAYVFLLVAVIYVSENKTEARCHFLDKHRDRLDMDELWNLEYHCRRYVKND